MKQFNANSYVKVKLTDIGRAEHKKQHDQLCIDAGIRWAYVPPKEDEDGYSSWQLHGLMNTFGHMMCIGFILPFEPNILINESDLMEVE